MDDGVENSDGLEEVNSLEENRARHGRHELLATNPEKLAEVMDRVDVVADLLIADVFGRLKASQEKSWKRSVEDEEVRFTIVDFLGETAFNSPLLGSEYDDELSLDQQLDILYKSLSDPDEDNSVPLNCVIPTAVLSRVLDRIKDEHADASAVLPTRTRKICQSIVMSFFTSEALPHVRLHVTSRNGERYPEKYRVIHFKEGKGHTGAMDQIVEEKNDSSGLSFPNNLAVEIPSVENLMMIEDAVWVLMRSGDSEEYIEALSWLDRNEEEIFGRVVGLYSGSEEIKPKIDMYIGAKEELEAGE